MYMEFKIFFALTFKNFIKLDKGSSTIDLTLLLCHLAYCSTSSFYRSSSYSSFLRSLMSFLTSTNYFSKSFLAVFASLSLREHFSLLLNVSTIGRGIQFDGKEIAGTPYLKSSLMTFRLVS